jgi:FkbM family methyltransferase
VFNGSKTNGLLAIQESEGKNSKNFMRTVANSKSRDNWMKRTSELLSFLSSDLAWLQKLRIVLGYYFFSRGKSIKIFRMTLDYASGLKNHSLFILKEIFLNQIYTFTKDTDQKIMNLNGGVIIDVGANIGIATAYFKHKYPHTKLIAIEASPINYNQLVKNIKTNKFQNIETINCFVSNSNSKIVFHHNVDKPGGSFGEGAKSKESKNLIEFEVESQHLSNIISGLKNIAIKIDVEGAEYEILKDLAESENICEVLEISVEVSTRNQVDYDALNNVLRDFADLGFEPRIISDYSTTLLKDKKTQGHLQLILFKA